MALFLAGAATRGDVVSPPAAAPPPGAAITIDADRVSFDRPAHTAIGEGNAVVSYQGATLRADRIRLDTETKDVWAEGNVRLNRQGTEWVVPAAHYNFGTGQFDAEHARGFAYPLILGAATVRSTDTNRYAFTRGTLTTCDYEHPHCRWEAGRGEVWPGDRVVLYNCTMRFGDVPVFWVPIIVWSLEGDYPPFALTLGHTSDWGLYILTSTYWRFNDGARLTVHLDERTERGLAGGADFGYKLADTGRGKLRGYYAKDDDADAGIEEDRYRAQWQHKQELADDLTATVYLNKLSDEKIIRDFFPHEFSGEREPDNVADVTKRWPTATLSLLARPQINEFFAEVERLPEVTLAVNRTRLGPTPLFYEGVTSAGFYHNAAGDTGDPLLTGHSARADSLHQLVMPGMLWGWLSVVPRAGARGTWYEHAPSGASETADVTRVVFDAGLDSSFKISRTWPGAQSARWRIDGLRHILEPFVNYQWVPEPNVRPAEVFQFDTVRMLTLGGGDPLSVTRFSPLDFPAYNSVDSIDAQNTVRFGLRQRLQTRRKNQPWDLVELTGWTDWRIEQNGAERDFSDFFGTLRISPAEWIAQDVGARYDFNNGVLRELNTATSLFHGSRWRVNAATRYLRDDSHTIALLQYVQLTHRLGLHTAHRFDMEDGFLEEQQYGLKQDTHDWLIDYGVFVRGERTRGDEVGIFVSVTLKSYPGFSLSVDRINVSSQTDTGSGN
jgi:hypothetical protein